MFNIILILLKFLVFDNHGSKEFNISILIIIFIPIIITDLCSKIY